MITTSVQVDFFDQGDADGDGRLNREEYHVVARMDEDSKRMMFGEAVSMTSE